MPYGGLREKAVAGGHEVAWRTGGPYSAVTMSRWKPWVQDRYIDLGVNLATGHSQALQLCNPTLVVWNSLV
mgnify:CR=1 FL=1